MARGLFCCIALTCVCIPSVIHGAEKPNIIFVFIDDLGWKDLGCYGNDFVDTPHIDNLASSGIRFTDAYAAGAVCSPTRCAVQSGQNQARIGITAHIPGHWRPFERVITPLTTMALPLDTVTVAEALKESGYATGYVGKWHLGRGPGFQPDDQGYDFTAVIGGPHLPGKYSVQGRADLQPQANQYRTDFEADLSIDFIKKNKDRPFFLMLSPFAVHIPLGAMSEKVDKYLQRARTSGRSLPHPVYAAMIEHCDDMLGRIVDTVNDEGLTNDTMIVFTSDNGGLRSRYDYRPGADDIVTSLAPLKGEKGSLHEGGVRVPLIVKYPRLAPAGAVCSEPTISYDFYPTFVDFAGGTLPQSQTIDGISLRPLLKKPQAKLPRAVLHWHYPHYHHDRPASSIRQRDWKLIEYLDGTNDVELYRLATDIGETTNLARDNPGRVKDLQNKLRDWRHQISARMPIPNPSYDATRASEWWNMRTGKPIDSDGRRRFPPMEKDVKSLILPGESFFVDNRPAFTLLPPAAKRQTPQPWVMYAPTLPGLPDQHEKWMHEQILSAGVAVCGIDVGEAYGSPKAQMSYDAFYRELTENRGFAKKCCLLGRSRGGLWNSSWAIRNPEKIAGFAGIYPVLDLTSWPGIERAAPAFEMSPDELTRQLKQHNPIEQIEVLAKVRVPVLLIHGDEDQAVPIEKNSAEVVRRYSASGAEKAIQLITAEGQGHNYWQGFFRCQPLIDFVISTAQEGDNNQPASKTPENASQEQ